MRTFHPVAWLFWLGAATLPALLTRNPLYLCLALLSAGVVYLALGRSPAAQSWGSFVRFGALLWLLTIPFTMLTVHYGVLVLFSLPAGWPVIGGPMTGEALLFGLSSGLALLTLLLAFAAFNTAVDQARLLRLTPGFLYQTGIIAAIAVAFVPQMVAAWQAIREAQEVRGHRVRGVRDLLPLLLPLLVTALERAMHLAESMEARGFGRQLQPITPRRRLAQQLAVLGGLVLLAAGLAGAGLWPDRPGLVAAALADGALLLGLGFWDQGRRVQRTHYRRWYWTGTDRLVLALGALGILGWLGAWLRGGGASLLYYPYPPYSPWPAFDPWLAVLALLPALPALLLGSPAGSRQRPPAALGPAGPDLQGAHPAALVVDPRATPAGLPAAATPQPGSLLAVAGPASRWVRRFVAALLVLLLGRH